MENLLKNTLKVKAYIKEVHPTIFTNFDESRGDKVARFIRFSILFNIDHNEDTNFHHRNALHVFGQNIKTWEDFNTKEKVEAIKALPTEFWNDIGINVRLGTSHIKHMIDMANIIEKSLLMILNLSDDKLKEAILRATKSKEKIEKTEKGLDLFPILREGFYSSCGLFGFIMYLCTVLLRIIDEDDKAPYAPYLLMKFNEEISMPAFNVFGKNIGIYSKSEKKVLDIFSSLLEEMFGGRLECEISTIDSTVFLKRSLKLKKFACICGKIPKKIIYPVSYDESENDNHFPRRHFLTKRLGLQVVTVCSRKCLNECKKSDVEVGSIEITYQQIAFECKFPQVHSEKPVDLGRREIVIINDGNKESKEQLVYTAHNMLNIKNVFEDIINNHKPTGILFAFDCTGVFTKKNLDSFKNSPDWFFVTKVHMKKDSAMLHKSNVARTYFCFESRYGCNIDDFFMDLFLEKKPNLDNFGEKPSISIFEISLNNIISVEPRTEEKAELVLDKIFKSNTCIEIKKYIWKKYLGSKYVDFEYSSNEDFDMKLVKYNLMKKTECWNCHYSEDQVDLSKCKGCLKARYCSEKCQKEDWKNHKDLCIRKQKKKREEKTTSYNDVD